MPFCGPISRQWLRKLQERYIQSVPMERTALVACWNQISALKHQGDELLLSLEHVFDEVNKEAQRTMNRFESELSRLSDQLPSYSRDNATNLLDISGYTTVNDNFKRLLLEKRSANGGKKGANIL